MPVAEDFESERAYLVRLSYRMLGSVADAEDVVQTAYVRWHSAGQPTLDNIRAWFTTTCTRLCLDRLRSDRRTREEYVGEWLPEPYCSGVDDRLEVDETLSMALLYAIHRLSPTERAAFLLHDVFGYEFSAVADILRLQPANCRQLAVRARRRLEGYEVDAAVSEELIEELSSAFFAAVAEGDLDGLEKVLATDVVLRADGGGKVSAARSPVLGRRTVARFILAVLGNGGSLRVALEPTWFNGAPGVLLRTAGRPESAFQFHVRGGVIAAIFVQRNPDKLAGFGERS